MSGRDPRAATPVAHRVCLVNNAADGAPTGAYLAALGGPENQRVVVRPTPGEHSLAVLASDVLVALGKNPEVMRAERLGSRRWELARAWTIGLGVRDVVVDRVHLLTVAQIAALIELAAGQANVWLVYGGLTVTELAEQLTRQGHEVERLFWEQLPMTLRPAPPSTSRFSPPWPVLPVADFTTFLAACLRHLGRADFERVAAVFYPAAERADVWAETYRGADPGQLTRELTIWLRDEQFPHALPAAAALITLRATQAALFVRRLLLSCDTTALGPDPAARLPGDLTTHRVAALGSFARTDHAAAAALSLHLNVGPIGFGCWQCGDVDPDGAQIQQPREHGTHPYQTWPVPAELACDMPILVPAHARPIVAAHLAYRRAAGAGDTDPLFLHPTDNAQPVYPGLRLAIQRINERININTPWMHRGYCRWGADAGGNPRSPGWLGERGLSLQMLFDELLYPRLPTPRPQIRTAR